jgi:hypothetical protein
MLTYLIIICTLLISRHIHNLRGDLLEIMYLIPNGLAMKKHLLFIKNHSQEIHHMLHQLIYLSLFKNRRNTFRCKKSKWQLNRKKKLFKRLKTGSRTNKLNLNLKKLNKRLISSIKSATLGVKIQNQWVNCLQIIN